MDWTAVVDFAVTLAQIALCGWLVYGAALAAIATFSAERNQSSAPRGWFRPFVEFEHTE